MEGSGRLDSWKAIAGYLNRDVRTVQRWERAEGLPVHRHQHAERGSVYAFTFEIDAWLAERRTPIAPTAGPARRRAAVAAGLGCVAILAAAGWLLTRAQHGTVALADPGFDPPRLLDALLRDVPRVRIPVGAGDQVVVASPDGRRVFVASTSSNAVRVFNADSGAIERAFHIESPILLVLAADGSRLWIAQRTGGLLALDTRSWTSQEIPGVPRVRHIALTRDASRLYLAAEYAGLLVLDTATGTVRQLSSVTCPTWLALSPDDRRLYVDYQCGRVGGRPDVLDVVDTATGQVVDTIGGFPNVGNQVAVTTDGEQLWVDGHDVCISPQYDHTGCPMVPGRVVHILRASDHRVLKVLGTPLPAIGYRAGALTVVPGGHRIAVTTPGVGIAVHDTMTLNLVEAVDLPVQSGFAFDASLKRAFVVIGEQLHVLPLERRRRAPAGLAAQWTADGTAADAIRDSHLQPSERASYRPGRIGAAFAFDGTVSLSGRAPNVVAVSLPFSAMAWVRFASAPGSPMALVTASEPESRQPIRAWTLIRDGEQRLAWCAGATADGCAGARIAVTGRTQLLPDRWYHVAVARSQGSVALYVDGTADANQAIDWPMPPSVCHVEVRAGIGEAGAMPLRGLLDEIEIYERALSPAEIAARAAVPR